MVVAAPDNQYPLTPGTHRLEQLAEVGQLDGGTDRSAEPAVGGTNGSCRNQGRPAGNP